ncbi:MAG: hypothetical protein FWE60_03810 [Oscillospiraceae bacterium]|nr:hypothetical protein [Oscillospiraceae bacterium]
MEEIEVVDLGEDGIKIIFTKEQNEIWLIAFEVCADCLRSPCVCIIFEIWGCFFCGGEDHKGLCSNIEGITASIWIDDNGIKLEGSNEYDTIISIENVEKLEISINFIDDADSYDFIKGYEIRPFYDKVRVISLGKHKLAITIPNPFDFPELITAYGVNTNPFIKNVELVEIDFFIVHANNTITFIITDDLFFIILVGDPPFPGFCSYCGEVSCECKEEPAVCADCEKVSCECKKEPAVCADCEKVSCECKEEPELQPETPELPPDDIKISVVSEIPGVLATISPGLMISIAGGEPFKADPDKLTLKVEKKTPKNTEAFFTALLAYLK